MLAELSIRNLAVIESVRLQGGQGFHVLTGETGAGKSIIIDALGLIIGGRSSVDLVRHGSDKAEIEAVFDLAENHPVWALLAELGIEGSADDGLIIRREVTSQGKSTARINGQLVNLTMLREVGEWLVNIHGQHEHQSLLKVEHHLQWLDLYAEEEIGPLKARYKASYDKYIATQKVLEELHELSKQGLQMLDLYRFQIQELEDANLKSGEDESLFEERQKLSNAEKLYMSSSAAYSSLYDHEHGLDRVGKAVEEIEQIVTYDSAVLQPLLEQIQSAFYQLEDAANELRQYRDQVEFNPERLNEIEDRLALLAGLKRKYGESIDDILAHLATIKSEAAAIENKDERIQQLEAELQKEEEQLMRHAALLSKQRAIAAEKLAEQIEVHLQDLHMERTRFAVDIKELSHFTAEGRDGIEFMISTNPGEPVKPLHKIASGGELSRIMLALKAIFAHVDRIPVLVFDEVDTGVSGRAAQAIAEKLSKLSRECQVFSITHLPQVACMADLHYAIRKDVADERTFTLVDPLYGEDQVAEMARLLGGVEVTETTEHHAKEMLDMAQQKKQQWNHLQ